MGNKPKDTENNPKQPQQGTDRNRPTQPGTGRDDQGQQGGFGKENDRGTKHR